MRFKIDENVPKELVGLLAGSGHEADTVDRVGLDVPTSGPLPARVERSIGFASLLFRNRSRKERGGGSWTWLELVAGGAKEIGGPSW